MDLYKSTAHELHDKLVNKEISSVELTKALYERIDAVEDQVKAYVTLDKENALAQAAKVDAMIAAGEKIAPLAGIPGAIKDNICTKGLLTTCSSKMLANVVPIYDAHVIKKLRAEETIFLGKTNMDEFAMGSSCETSCFGGATNPFNTDHVAGGSSGGVASAVGGDIAAFGLGSDTGGSIRQPASFCGIVGLKPTYGAVSRYGLVAYASSLDQIGPIAKTVEDASLVYDVISEYDENDSTCEGRQGEPTYDTLNNDIKGMKIGIAREYLEGVREDVKEAVLEAAKKYEEMGAEIVYFDLPALKFALPVYYILACAEASSNLGRYDGIRYGYKTEHYEGIHDMICKTRSEGFGEEVKRRILLGTYVLSAGYYDAYYKKAQNLRGTIIKAFDDAFKNVDVILAPTVPMTAFKSGEATSDPVETYLTDICTVPINIAGLPSVSVPCGFNKKGMPIGMQIIGDKFKEGKILNVAYKYEQACPENFKDTKWGVKL